MATLALAREFLADFSKLDAILQKRIHDLAAKCRQLSLTELNQLKGIHLETHKAQKDPRARTIRLGDNHRGIALVPEGTEQIVLVDVLLHQEAERWMANNEFSVNAATGALEVFDAGAIAQTSEATAAAAAPSNGGPALFAHRRDKDFVQLGINEDLVPTLRLLEAESQLEGLLTVLPQGQAEALILLTGRDAVETIYAEIAGSTKPDEVDTEDLAAAVHAPASRSTFHVVTDEDELAEMLALPLEQWRTYLHQSQHAAAYRREYSGPARVTGGAGTGKTVVAMHRTKALADQLDDRSLKPILFTTFTRNLAQSIENDLRLLGGTDLLDVVEVVNVDSLAHRLVRDAEGRMPEIASDDDCDALFELVVDELGYELPPSFIRQEWEQVVLAQGLDSRDDYFRAPRAGRGTQLHRQERAKVWRVIEAVRRRLDERQQRTFLQMAAAAAGYLGQEQIKPYRHVIVDEAQDLHESQWRLLRAVVAESPNDLFIVGDSHQRIYRRRSSLSKVGIDIRGRSRKLRINYRTTRQILRWSLAVLGEGEYDDLDEGTDVQDVAGYHSFLEGPDPTCESFSSKGAMIDGLVAQVNQWVAGGVNETDIGIAARTQTSFGAVEEALRTAGIRPHRLQRDLDDAEGVAIGTMHRMKGLEYRCMAVIDVSADDVPLAYSLTPKYEDPVQHTAEVQRERCLLYVACTRARDDLWVGWSGKPSPFLDPVLARSEPN
jgi:superfamily I DNA/RNA helicase